MNKSTWRHHGVPYYQAAVHSFVVFITARLTLYNLSQQLGLGMRRKLRSTFLRPEVY